jgi:hypothetical protein
MPERLGTIEISARAAALVSAISIPIAVLTLVGAVALAAALHPVLGNSSVIEIGVPLLLALLGTLFVHEGMHAVAFLALGGHPRFGTMRKGGLPFLYVSCPGRLFPPIRFVAVGLAPLILLDVAALGLLTHVPTVGVAIGVLCVNTPGSVGDLWLSRLVLSRGWATRWEALDGRFVLWGPPTPSA